MIWIEQHGAFWARTATGSEDLAMVGRHERADRAGWWFYDVFAVTSRGAGGRTKGTCKTKAGAKRAVVRRWRMFLFLNGLDERPARGELRAGLPGALGRERFGPAPSARPNRRSS